MRVLYGKSVADHIYKELIERIAILKRKNITPVLVVIIVGNRTDSLTYISMKNKKCVELGIDSIIKRLEVTITTSELIEIIEEYNNDKSIHGILVQMPLPDTIDKNQILDAVRIDKDVDGFHCNNMGLLTVNRNPLFSPCTPVGCIELLDYYSIPIEGQNIVIIGRSTIVGLPLLLMLIHRNATVAICHSKTREIEKITRMADIVITACGKPLMVKKEWLKKDSVVIDVGINSIPDSSKKRGYRLVGDTDFANVENHVSAITPVPGGIGPLTIAILMKHTIIAAENSM